MNSRTTYSQNFVYIKSEPKLWTVGFYDPAGKFQPDSDHDTKQAAARRVCQLNGAYIEPAEAIRKVLVEVHDYWAGGDCPPDLWKRINDVLAETQL